MDMRYKEDWEEAKLRYKAWWAHENFGRCGLWVTAPRDGVPDEPPPQRVATPGEDPREKWCDLDFIAAQSEYSWRHTFYGGEAFPAWHGGFACHRNVTAYLGCPVVFDVDSVWVHPLWTGDTLDYRSLRLDEDCIHFQHVLELQTRAVVDAQKAGVIAQLCVNLSGCGDMLAGIRGTERLLLDVMDQPDEVRKADQALMDIQLQVYDRFYEMTHEAADGGMACFPPVWAPGKYYATQNDFAYMLSPKQFRDIFLPTIEKQLEHLDHSIHHLDGEGNFNHIDALLELPKMRAIQVLPGAGKPSALHYRDLCKKIQAAGRNLWMHLPPQEVKQALDELSACGLFIHTRCETEAEARELLKNAEKWSRDRA